MDNLAKRTKCCLERPSRDARKRNEIFSACRREITKRKHGKSSVATVSEHGNTSAAVTGWCLRKVTSQQLAKLWKAYIGQCLSTHVAIIMPIAGGHTIFMHISGLLSNIGANAHSVSYPAADFCFFRATI